MAAATESDKEKLFELKSEFDRMESKLKVAQDKYNQDCSQIEEIEEETRKVESETRHIKEMSHQKDVLVKFFHEHYVKRLNDCKSHRQTYDLLLEKQQGLKKQVKEFDSEPEQLTKKFSGLLKNQKTEYEKQKSIYQSIKWAQAYKIIHSQNAALKDELDEGKRKLNEEKNKLNNYENELLAMGRNDLPWASVCIQFSEWMLKNMQMKNYILDAEFKVAAYSKTKDTEKKNAAEKAKRSLSVSPHIQKPAGRLPTTPIKEKSPEPMQIDVDEPEPKRPQQQQRQDVLKALQSAVFLSTSKVDDIRTTTTTTSGFVSPKRPLQEIPKDNFTPKPTPIEEPCAKKPKINEEIVVHRPTVDFASDDNSSIDSSNRSSNLAAPDNSFGFSVPLNKPTKLDTESPTDFLRSIFAANDSSTGNADGGNFFNPFGSNQNSKKSNDSETQQTFDFFGNLGGGDDGAPDTGFTFNFNMGSGDNDSNRSKSPSTDGFLFKF